MVKKAEIKITAKMVLDLLADKHWKDVFVSECKNGASYGSGLLKLDAWTMNKSWANACATGYEIKVSRGDFMQDKKWHGYLDYCNEFYFVCPTGLIKPEECPDQAGLMYVSKTGTRLFRKKKAPFRHLSIPKPLYMYVLMYRVRIDKERHNETTTNMERLKNWLAQKKEKADLDYRIKGRINEIVDRVQDENRKLKSQMEKYDGIKRCIKELGFDVSKRVSEWTVRDKLEEMVGELPRDFESDVEKSIEILQYIKERLPA